MVPSDWRQEFEAVVSAAQARVVGQQDVENEAQANVISAFLEPYGQRQQATFYIEPCLAKQTHQPPDLVVCSPELGVLVVEVKGWSLDFIERLDAGSFYLRSNGFPKPQNPIRQAQKVLFGIRDAAQRMVEDIYDLPLFSYLVALPNISQKEWQARGFAQGLPLKDFLFEEQIFNPRHLKASVEAVVSEGLERARLSRPSDPTQLRVIRQVFGDSAVINEARTLRTEVQEDKLGAVFDDMAMAEKHLSEEQQELSRLSIRGHPRLIRGVAGSGKTVVLANQVARFVKRKLAEPTDLFVERAPLRVGVVCFNRTLVEFLRAKIGEAYAQMSKRAFPEESVTVTHYQGLLYQLAQQGYWDYIRYREGNSADLAIRYRQQWTDPLRRNDPPFDAIFIDEGQDLGEEELQLLHDLIKTDPETGEKNLIVFYDDAQNLYGRPRPTWNQLGISVQGRSRVMKQCFRNTKEIVDLAFNVLIGSQAPEALRVQTRTYADVAFLKEAALIEETSSHVSVRFAQRSFFKPVVSTFQTVEEEKQWLLREVCRLITEEEVRPEDILILLKDPKPYADLAERLLQSLGPAIEGTVQPYHSGKPEDVDHLIFRPGHLTLATIYGAKGYDAHAVFLLGVDRFEPDDADNKGRAAFYVGATRAKNVLYLSGLERPEHTLLTEALRVQALAL